MTWTENTLLELYELPFFELLSKAHETHKNNFALQDIELCSLCSIKTGSCPENCAYCPQSAHYKTGVQKESLLDKDMILLQAQSAQEKGAKRFCMGGAWRSLPKRELPFLVDIIKSVKGLGFETCATFGMLEEAQAIELKKAGLDYYNHNLDTSPEYYSTIITTRTYDDRLKTIEHLIKADIKVCCGGILGMGESRIDRVNFLLNIYKLPTPPKSIPINHLIPIPGTPLENQPSLDIFEFVKTIAVTRLMFPTTRIRLAAGREKMSLELQAWCFMAGANSIFIGEKLLTAQNPSFCQDKALLENLGLQKSA